MHNTPKVGAIRCPKSPGKARELRLNSASSTHIKDWLIAVNDVEKPSPGESPYTPGSNLLWANDL